MTCRTSDGLPNSMMLDFHNRIRKTLTIDVDAPAIEYEGRWTTWGQLKAIVEGVDDALERVGAPADAAVGAVLAQHAEPRGPGTVAGGQRPLPGHPQSLLSRRNPGR